METTVEKFIERLNQISPKKKKLPLVIYAPNGLECSPNIKIIPKEGTFMTEEFEVEKMVITWEE